MKIPAVRASIVVGLFGLWELLSRTGLVNPRLLPPASDVLATLWDILQRPAVHADLVTTALEALVAFAISVPVSVLIGLVLAESRYLGGHAEAVVLLHLQCAKIDLPSHVHSRFRNHFLREGSFWCFLDDFHSDHEHDGSGRLRTSRARDGCALFRGDARANNSTGLSPEHVAGTPGGASARHDLQFHRRDSC